MGSSRPLQGLLAQAIGATELELLHSAAVLAATRGERLHLVGGFLRDFLLGLPSRDLDLVVEGDGMALARDLAGAQGLRVCVYPTFLTAGITSGTDVDLNFATARREHYTAPATLPRVEPATLEEDLWRRDFTVNALAAEITAAGIGEIFDPCGGRADLKAKALRILHERSFFDDPTRAFRAIRFEARLGFALELESRRGLDAALAAGALDALSGARLTAELDLIFSQLARPSAVLRHAGELGLLASISPELKQADALVSRFEALAEPVLHELFPGRAPITQGRLALLFDLPEVARLQAMARLGWEGELGTRVRQAPSRLQALGAELAAAALPHQAACLLVGLPMEERALLWTLAPEARKWLAWAGLELENRRLQLRGKDLIAAGVSPGPRLGAALAAAQDARWDGDLEASDELAYALEFLGRPADG